MGNTSAPRVGPRPSTSADAAEATLPAARTLAAGPGDAPPETGGHDGVVFPVRARQPGATMKTCLTYGFAMAFGGMLVVFAMFFLGMHDSPEKLDTAQGIQTGLGLALGVACIVSGTKARRAEVPAAEPFGYGAALGTGVMIALFAALLGLLTNYLYGAVINPHFTGVMLQAQVDKLAANGVPSDKIEQIQKMTAVMMKPPVLAAMGFVSGMLFGTLISLITAAFLKRPAAENLADAPPPLT